MTEFLQRTVDGLLGGSAYALVGLGLSVTFGGFKRLNLAHGATAMLAAYVGSWLYTSYEVSAVVVAAAVVASAALIGWYVAWLCFAHTQGETGTSRGGAPVAGRDGREVVALAASFAIWMQLEQLAVKLIPQHLVPFPEVLSAHTWYLGEMAIRADRLLLLALAMLLTFGAAHWVEHSRTGLAWRAASDHRTAAHLMGIPVAKLQTLTFVIGSVLAGLAAFALLSVDGQLTPMFGMWVLLKGLVAAVVGGLGTIRGVFWGGLLLGLVEAHAQAWWGPQGRDFATYALLFIVLVSPWRHRAAAGSQEASAVTSGSGRA